MPPKRCGPSRYDRPLPLELLYVGGRDSVLVALARISNIYSPKFASLNPGNHLITADTQNLRNLGWREKAHDHFTVADGRQMANWVGCHRLAREYLLSVERGRNETRMMWSLNERGSGAERKSMRSLCVKSNQTHKVKHDSVL